MSADYDVLIPLQAVPYKQYNVTINNQSCIITIRTMNNRCYFGISMNGTVIRQPDVLMQNRTRLVRSAYSGFVGDIAIIDTQGDEPPLYTGLGSRWLLVYSADI